jgi:hypothetical protein
VREVELRIPLVAATLVTSSTAPVQEPGPSHQPAKGGPSPLVFAGAGLAVSGLVVGGVTGLLAMAKASTVKDNCHGTVCDPSVRGDVSSGRTLGNVSTVAFAAAGVGAALGIVGLALWQGSREEPKTDARFSPWIGPASAGVSGTF